ncbi:MAG TPA: outer membrane beta-barrel protein [Gemmatimonadales bacterium]|nr:outer membrane beta-barrel protein [Gemmatimonadales bacterium]
MTTPRWLAGWIALVAPPAVVAQTGDSSGSAVKLSGYVTSSYVYASKPTGQAIVGRLYDRFHDSFIMNAARLTIQKPVATDKLDAGFQVDALFGQNAPPLQSAGLKLGDQGDLPQAFVTLNVPTGGGNYVEFKGGKMWTLLDVEVVDEVLNPNFSHGYQFIYLTNFTTTGLGLDAKFSATVDAEVRVFNGWDLVQDNNTGKSFMARLGVTPSDRAGLAFFAYVGPEQPNNTSHQRYGGEFVGTFKPATPTTIYVQFDAGREQGIAAGGADARWWGAGLWGVFNLDPKLTLALRGDYMADRDGVRTSGVLGFGAAPSRRLTSGTATLNVKTWPHALVRPEIRVEHSSRDDFGDAGSLSPTQVTVGLALSYLF